jgi:hypothetical protein
MQYINLELSDYRNFDMDNDNAEIKSISELTLLSLSPSLPLSLYTHTHTHMHHNLFGNNIEDPLPTSHLLLTVATRQLHSALLSQQAGPQVAKRSQRSNRLCESAAASELLAC